MTVRTIQEIDPTDALILLAFPSTGAASPIAAQYIIQHLEMPLVGDVQHPAFAGVMHVQQGRPTGPVRIYGGDIACELDGPCQRTFIVTTELPVPPEAQQAITESVLAWASGARLVLSLDAVSRDVDDETPDLFAVHGSDVAARRMGSAPAKPLPSGLITGMTAFAVAGAAERNLPAAALIVEARAEHPDGRAAAALITGLDPLIPQIHIDAEPLMKDALELETQIKQAMADAERAQEPRRTGHSFI